MKSKRYTDEQKVKILKEVDSGVPVKEVLRKHGVSSPTYYKWRSKFSGLEVSDVKKMRDLEDQNRKLKQMVADQALDIVALKDVLSKKW